VCFVIRGMESDEEELDEFAVFNDSGDPWLLTQAIVHVVYS
jgi:hypothetical protein